MPGAAFHGTVMLAGKNNPVIYIHQLQRAIDGIDRHDDLEAGVTMIGPAAIRLSGKVLDLRLILGDEQVVLERRVPRLITLEFLPAIKRFGGRRQHFHNDGRVEKHVGVGIMILPFAAYHDKIGVGIQAAGIAPRFRNRTAPNLGALDANSTRLAFQLASQGDGEIHRDVGVVAALAGHRINPAVQILMPFLRRAFKREILVDRVHYRIGPSPLNCSAPLPEDTQ